MVIFQQKKAYFWKRAYDDLYWKSERLCAGMDDLLQKKMGNLYKFRLDRIVNQVDLWLEINCFSMTYIDTIEIVVIFTYDKLN